MSTPPASSTLFSSRLGLLYAGGDVGPSITSLCLSFYWLYFLIEVAGIPTLQAGMLHGSGYLFSAFASLWAGDWLDRRAPAAATRCRLVAAGGTGLACIFVLLWWAPALGSGKILWYLALSWLFHLLFALVYLAYLSLTPLLATSEKERIDLNSYRFGGTMLLTLLILGMHGATESILNLEQRLLALGGAVALLAAAGSILCGNGLAKTLETVRLDSGASPVPWRTLARSRILWWAVGGNLAVWLMVQTATILTIFLCASAGVSDARILLVMQFCIIVAAALTSLGGRRWSAGTIMAVAALLWCTGAALWWGAGAPMAAALLLGLGLGTGTVISWAQVPVAIDSLATAGKANARAYAGLTVLRDLVSATVPVLATLALDSHPTGSPEAGQTAAGLLIVMGLGCALTLLALQSLRQPGLAAASADIAETPR